MRETLQELAKTAWELVSGSAAGFAELPWNKARKTSFPKSWLFHIALPLGWAAGFGLGVLAIAIGIFSGVLTLISNWGKEDR